MSTELSTRRKAAILLLTLGSEKSASLFKHLKESEIESLTLEISNVGTLVSDVKEEVLKEFYEICLAQKYIIEGGLDYAKQILEQAFGEDKAFEIITKLTASLKVKPFDFIRKTDPSQIINFIQNEHPQTIALILSYLTPKNSSEILSELPSDKQSEVAKRIALMDKTSPETVRDIEHVLEKKLSSILNEDYTNVGGIDLLVEILSAVDRSTEKRIIENLEENDPELAEEIRKRMFVFEDILKIDNRSVQRILRENIDTKELATALKGSSEELQQLIFMNVSSRLASLIKEEMEILGAVRKTDVEISQQKIVNSIRALQETGEIVINRGGDDLVE